MGKAEEFRPQSVYWHRIKGLVSKLGYCLSRCVNYFKLKHWFSVPHGCLRVLSYAGRAHCCRTRSVFPFCVPCFVYPCHCLQTPLLEEKLCFLQSHSYLLAILCPPLHTNWSQKPVLCTSRILANFLHFCCCCLGLAPSLLVDGYSLFLTPFSPVVT